LYDSSLAVCTIKALMSNISGIIQQWVFQSLQCFDSTYSKESTAQSRYVGNLSGWALIIFSIC